VKRPPETVHSEEIRALFEQVRPVLWANVAVAALVCATLWNHASRPRLVGWFVALCLLTLLRVLFHASYSRERPPAGEIESWGRRFVVASTASGLLWGAAGALFFASDSLLSQGLLAFALAGMTAGAAGTLASHLPAFFGYFVPALLPLAVRALLEGDRIHLGMVAMLVAYGLGMQRVARNNHAAFARAFSLALENQQLAEQLSLSQVELQETNHTLEQRVVERTQALEQQTEVLRQAQRLEIAGRLAGGLAHDFNSLLTVVTNNAKALKDLPALDEQGRQAADEVLQAGQRGVALIRQLLAFGRSKRAEPRVFSLNQLVREWGELLRHILGQAVTIETQLDPRAPDARADPAQVEQVLVNLVASAGVKLQGGGTLRLVTRARQLSDDRDLPSADYVELTIEYFGPTAGEDESRRAFDPLLSIDADSRQRERGLSAVWQLARDWGGRIVADADLHPGTRFRVLLPSAGVPRRSATTPTPSSKTRRSATILVVDDEPTLRAVIRRALVREGYSVICAEDGPSAQKLSSGHSGAIDLLVTDVVMPGQSGLSLARELRAQRPGLAVLFISGFTFEESVPANDANERLAYLPKPFDTQQLTDRVQELLSGTRRSDAPLAVPM
jgi:signal transduction histidine kinase/ActR/RegA family two-component response regulator